MESNETHLSHQELINFYNNALKISNEQFLTQSQFSIQLQKKWEVKGESIAITTGIFTKILPWVSIVLANICPFVYEEEKELPEHMYIFIAVFNCIKNLLLLYI